jgi:predicted GNAT superfamily acetyltransferase
MSTAPPTPAPSLGVCQAASPRVLRILETPEQMAAVEELTRAIWAGNDLEVVPAHLLLAAAHNGGLVAGAFVGDRLAGFVFGFPSLEATPAGLQVKHYSHELGVHPDYRDRGLGFELKRFQWQIVRGQGIRRITWTYDPLLSRNARLNIAKLGAVCNTYLRDAYGELRDDLNAGLPTDRFHVDWWLDSPRVATRMAEGLCAQPALQDYLRSGTWLLNPPDPSGAATPPHHAAADRWGIYRKGNPTTALVEIPTDFLSVKAADPGMALAWRLGTRACFESLFGQGFAVTDFLHEPGPPARAVYVLRRDEKCGLTV